MNLITLLYAAQALLLSRSCAAVTVRATLDIDNKQWERAFNPDHQTNSRDMNYNSDPRHVEAVGQHSLPDRVTIERSARVGNRHQHRHEFLVAAVY